MKYLCTLLHLMVHLMMLEVQWVLEAIGFKVMLGFLEFQVYIYSGYFPVAKFSFSSCHGSSRSVKGSYQETDNKFSPIELNF